MVSLSAALALSQMLLLPLFLSPASFGIAILALSLVQYMNQAADLGFVNAATRTDLSPATRAYFRETAFTLVSWVALLALVALWMSTLFAGFRAEVAVPLAIGVLTGWLLTPNRLRANAAAAGGNERHALWYGFAWQNANKAGMFLLLPTANVALTMLSGGLASAAAGRPLLPRFTASVEYLRRTARYWVPGLAASFSAFLLSWTETYVLGAYFGEEAMGEYQAVLRPLAGAMYIYIPLMTLIQASVSVKDYSRARRIRVLVLVLTLGALVVGATVLHAWGSTLWPRYQFPLMLVCLCATAVLFGALSMSYGIELVVAGRQLLAAWINAGSAVALGLSAVLLVPHLGLNGAALSATAGWGLAALLQSWVVWRMRRRATP
ncbi:MATE family efflux transporter [Microbacterium memoriense]|uniref:Lipopolysaccharide biosynthesis protein n=1 Tax=Microbacterium memoriense TaxID=2978350 RepID=A0ABT2PBF6_9MICO|nr:hypothetical protein [Microbacterium memoriense]MCT9001924.1 hypothetical protein [Microbacterium memoriense]